MLKYILVITLVMSVGFSGEIFSAEIKGGKVTKDVSILDLEKALNRISLETLNDLANDKEKRELYIKNVNAQKLLFERVKKEGFDKDPDVLQKIYREKQRIYLDALVDQEFKNSKQDFEELAKENYDAKPESYFFARKIKIAQIYILKSKADSKERLEKVKEALKSSKDPAVEFHELAREYADAKYKENQLYAGYYDKWLIEPQDHEKLPPPLVASFKLKKAGDISDVVETDKAYHIMKLMADSPRRPQEFADVKDDIIKGLRKTYWTNKHNKVLQSFMTKDEELQLNDELLKKQLDKALEERKASEKKTVAKDSVK